MSEKGRRRRCEESDAHCRVNNKGRPSRRTIVPRAPVLVFLAGLAAVPRLRYAPDVAAAGLQSGMGERAACEFAPISQPVLRRPRLTRL